MVLWQRLYVLFPQQMSEWLTGCHPKTFKSTSTFRKEQNRSFLLGAEPVRCGVIWFLPLSSLCLSRITFSQNYSSIPSFYWILGGTILLRQIHWWKEDKHSLCFIKVPRYQWVYSSPLPHVDQAIKVCQGMKSCPKIQSIQKFRKFRLSATN